MKKFLLIVFLIGSGLSQQPINYKTTLIDSNSIFYLSELPYSGPVFSLHNNGEIESKGNFINGWFEGLWKFWYDNGQLRAIGEFEKTIEKRTYDNGIPKNGKTGLISSILKYPDLFSVLDLQLSKNLFPIRIFPFCFLEEPP